MTFTNLHRRNGITLPDMELKTNTKYLGTIIENKIMETINRSTMKNTVCRKIYYKQIKAMWIVKVLFFPLVKTHLRYGIATWEVHPKPTSKVLFNQKRTIRCLAGINYQDNFHALSTSKY